jgi:hypothetical protein
VYLGGAGKLPRLPNSDGGGCSDLPELVTVLGNLGQAYLASRTSKFRLLFRVLEMHLVTTDFCCDDDMENCIVSN